MKGLLIQAGLFLVRTALAIALDKRVWAIAMDAVLQAEKSELTGPEKLKRAVEAVSNSSATKQLPGILRTLAVERAVEEVNRRLQ